MKQNKINLLDALVENSNEWMSSKVLSNLLDISDRTIKNYVKEINFTFNDIVILSSKQGYMIDIQKYLKINLDNNININKKGEIGDILIEKLLLSDTNNTISYNLKNMSIEMNYSRQFIRNKLLEQSKKLQANNINLKITNDDISLEGSDKDIRKLKANLIYNKTNDNYIDKSKIAELFPNINITKLSVIVLDELDYQKKIINDFLFNSILLHVTILLDQKQGDFKVAKIDTIISDRFISQIQRNFNVSFSQENFMELEILFNLKKVNDNAINDSDIASEDIRLFLDDIEKFIPFKFNNEELFNRLLYHLNRFMAREKNNRFQKNPMKKLIKARSPLIFEACQYAMSNFCNKHNLKYTEDEIGFIAIHIGIEIENIKHLKNKIEGVIYCPKYFDLAKQLKEKIEDNLKNEILITNIVEDEEELKKIDGICISLVDTNLKSRYFIQVSPLLTSVDMENIKNKIKVYKNDKLKIKTIHLLNKLTDEKYFLKLDNKINYLEAMDIMCSKLIEDGIVDQGFKEELIKREDQSATSFNKTAIPHALTYNANQSKVVIMINEKNIDWNGYDVKVVLLLCASNKDRELFIDLFESMTNFFEDIKLQLELSSCETLEEFIKLFVKRL